MIAFAGFIPKILVWFSVLLKVEGDGAFGIDMRVCDWGDVAQMAFGTVPIRVFLVAISY